MSFQESILYDPSSAAGGGQSVESYGLVSNDSMKIKVDKFVQLLTHLADHTGRYKAAMNAFIPRLEEVVREGPAWRAATSDAVVKSYAKSLMVKLKAFHQTHTTAIDEHGKSVDEVKRQLSNRLISALLRVSDAVVTSDELEKLDLVINGLRIMTFELRNEWEEFRTESEAKLTERGDNSRNDSIHDWLNDIRKSLGEFEEGEVGYLRTAEEVATMINTGFATYFKPELFKVASETRVQPTSQWSDSDE